jgi:serine/threonine protein kinase
MLNTETAHYVPISIPRVLRNYSIRNVIGQGSTAAVLEAVDTFTGKDYAMKVMSYSDLQDQNIVPRIERELAVLRRVDHPNVLRFHDFIRLGDLLIIVTEHYTGGDLLSWIVNGRLAQKLTLKRIFYEITLAVQSIHRLGIAHNDIKPENVVIDACGTAKLIDFGHARQTVLAGTTAKDGTLMYAAPELLRRGEYHTQKADIWALAILLYTMATAKSPFIARDHRKLIREIRNGRLKFQKNMDRDVEALIRRMAKVNPNERPTIEDVVEDPFFDAVRIAQRKDMATNSVRQTNEALEWEFEPW